MEKLDDTPTLSNGFVPAESEAPLAGTRALYKPGLRRHVPVHGSPSGAHILGLTGGHPHGRGGGHFLPRMRREIRSVLLLVNQYLVLRRLTPSREDMATLVEDINERATCCFASAALVFGDYTTPLHPDHQDCLRDLARFAQALSDDGPLSEDEAAHALDGVVVHCLTLDERRARRARRR